MAKLVAHWTLLSDTFHRPQIHFICALRLRPPLHPRRDPAAVGPGPRALQTDHRGRVP